VLAWNALGSGVEVETINSVAVALATVCSVARPKLAQEMDTLHGHVVERIICARRILGNTALIYREVHSDGYGLDFDSNNLILGEKTLPSWNAV